MHYFTVNRSFLIKERSDGCVFFHDYMQRNRMVKFLPVMYRSKLENFLNYEVSYSRKSENKTDIHIFSEN